MNCPACGEANRDGARFCISCGAPFELSCSSCGAKLPTKARFCDSCGATTDAPSDSPQASDAAATRKTVTVVFADLTGSTSIGERMDPEAFRALMGPFYASMRSEVESRGGVIAKFQGDGVMALFGIPDVREDDATRALDAAIAMQRAVAELPQREAVLALRIGINTGEVVIGEMDEDLVGDTINVASRLEGAAAPGEILVGEKTWRLTRSDAAYEPVAPLTLKGKAEPVPAFRLVALGEQGTEGSAAVFVGREREVSRLTAAFEEVLDASAARLVTIVGSPGLGKTRLAREFAGSLSDRAIVVETRCEAASSSTFAPVIEAIRSGAQIDEAAGPDAVLARVEEIVPATEPERERIVRLVAALLGAGSPGSTEETFWAVRRMIEIGASNGPIVFVLDDMHWAEPVLLDLIEHLSEYIRSAPVLLVVTGRPELRDIRPSLVEGGRALAVVALEGLDQGSTTRLACELLGGDPVPEELLARLPSSTEGNPLFVRELVRMLVDDGVLQRTDGSWTVTIDVDAIAVPPTIHSLLAARVDRLRAEERTILEMASVIGREFYRGALAELVPAPLRGTLDAHLESLRRKELVEPAGTYWIDEPVFHFHHVLIRDAAYRRLLKGARAELHERVARWLETKTAGLSGEHDEAIGYHLEQACLSRRQLGPLDDASIDLGRRAALLLGAEARRALDRDDHPAAAALATRALGVLDADDGVRAEPLILRCEALLGMGDVTDGTPAVRELERIATTERLAQWATCFDAELANLTDPARLREIEKRVAAAASALESLGDVGGSAKAHTVHAATLARLGRFAECEDELDHALTAARERGDRGRITSVLGALPQAALWGPHPVSRAGGRCLDVVRLLRITTQSPAVEAISSRCQAVLEALRGRADAARGMLRKARRVQSELGLRHGLLETELAHGIVELVDGDAFAAAEHLKIAHDGFLAMGVDASAAQAAALLGRACLAMGEEDDADAFADESERLGGDDVKTAIAWRAVRAEILARRGQVDEARRLAERAVELAAATDAVIDHGDAYMALAAVHRASGDTEAAKSAEDRAIALYERKGATALVERDVSSPVATASTHGSKPRLDNAATRASARATEALVARDWNAFSELQREDMLVDDRRTGLRDRYVGRGRYLEQVKVAEELRADSVEQTVIAIRGARLCLIKNSIGTHDGHGFGICRLQVLEVDELDRIAARVYFDEDELGAAMDELDKRFIAGEGAPFAETLRIAVEFNHRSNARDWAGWEQLMDPEHVLVDHRLASLGEVRTASVIVDVTRALIESLATSQAITVDLDASPGACMGETHVQAETMDGAPIEIELLTLMAVKDGKVSRTEYFPLNQRDAAQRRYAELAADRTWLDNAARRTSVLSDEAWLSGDVDGQRALADPGMIFIDRRHGLDDQRVGSAEIQQLMRSSSAIGIERVTSTPVAIRGETLCLERVGFIGSRYEVDLLRVTEIDEDGRISAAIAFDEDDLVSAINELDARFIAGEGAPFAETIQVAVEFNRRSNARDWAGWEALMHPDHVLVDHRPASLGEVRGASDIVAATRTMIEFLATSHAVSLDLHVANGACMSETHVRAETMDGAPIEIELIALMAVRDGLVKRTEYFPLEQLDAARARFAEFEGHHRLENRCSRIAETYWERFAERDLDGLRSIAHPGIVMQDRRSIVGGTSAEGLSASIEEWSVAVDLGVTAIEQDVVAVRGERLCLLHMRFIGANWEVEILDLIEIADDGRITAFIGFDADDVENAVDELDQRFIAGEGAPFADQLRASLRAGHAVREQNWDALADRFAPGFALVDHRPAILGRTGVDDAVALSKELSALVPDLRSYVSRYIALYDDLAMYEYVRTGHTTDGNLVDSSYLCVRELRDGLIVRMEVFPVDELDAAMERFEELKRTTAPLQNTCTRVLASLRRSYERRDWDALRNHLTEDTLHADRRAGLRNEASGVDTVLEIYRSAVPVGVQRVESSVLAIRGERLALFRSVYLGRDGAQGFRTELLSLCEVDAAGRLSYRVDFDPDDLDGAFEELDERFVAGEGAAFAEIVRSGGEIVRQVNARDWEGVARTLHNDFVVVDHGPASLGTLDKDGFLEASAALIELMDVNRSDVVAIRALAADASLGQILASGRTPDGAEVDSSLLVLTTYRDGLRDRLEYFPLEQLDAARARFDELTRDQQPSIENEAMRVLRKHYEAINARDLDLFVRCHAANLYAEDRRTGLADVREGLPATLDHMRLILEMDPFVSDIRCIATRGSKLALARVLAGGGRPEGAFEVEFLALCELDDAGLICRSVAFDPDQLMGAIEALEDRHLAGEGAPYARVLGVGVRWVRATNARDLDALRDLMSDDFVIHDHRPASLGELGRDGYLESLETLYALMDEFCYIPTRYLATSATANASEVVVEGRSADGNEFKMTMCGLAVFRDGRTTRLEVWPDDRRQDALDRFRELQAEETHDQLSNAATRAARRWVDYLVAADWERFADLHTPDCLARDTRKGLQTDYRGRGAIVALAQAALDLGRLSGDFAVLGVRGERLALVRTSWFGESGFLVEALAVCEVDDEGRLVYRCSFDPEQAGRAFEHLDERFIAGEGAPYRELIDVLLLVVRLVNTEGRIDEERHAADIIMIDHRPASIGEIRGLDALVEWVQTLGDLTSRRMTTMPRFHRLAPNRAVTEVVQEVVTADGAAFELRFLAVTRLRDGQIARIEYFPVDGLDDALTRFDELAEHERPAAAPLENAYTRSNERRLELIAASDWEAVAEQIAEDIVFEDRRHGFGWMLRGKSEFMANLRASIPGTALRRDVLAVRGERCGLARLQMTARGGFEVTVLCVEALDAHGRLSFSVLFDIDDLDGALAEIDERYLDEEGAAHADTVQLLARVARANNADDWDDYAACLDVHIVVIDHRPASFGEIRGRDRFVEWSRSLREVTSRRHTTVVRYHRIASSRAAVETLQEVATADGARAEIRSHGVISIINGRFATLDYYAIDRLYDALERYAELGRGRFEVENACTRVIDRMYSAGQAGLWDAMRDLYALDGVYEDRRPGFRNEVTGRETLVEHAKLANAGTDVRWEHLAIRGDRLALTRLRATIRDGFEVIVLAVHEIDAEDRLQHTVLFDGDDVDAAFDELDDRHLASAESTERDRLRVELIRAQNAGAWDRVRALLSDDFVLVDRRAVSFATVQGAEAYSEIYTSLSEVLHTWRTRVLQTSRDPYHTVVRTEAFDRDGNEIEWDVVSVSTTRDGKITRIESFEIEQVAEAIARARELEKEREKDLQIGNAATRALDNILRATEAGDWDSVTAVTPPESTVEDRRPGFRNRVTGRAEIVGHAKIAWARTETHIDHLATRGDRFALSRQLTSMKDGFEVETFLVYEIDAEGRFVSSVVFDQTQIDDAYADLDERFLASGDVTEIQRLGVELVRRLNASDWPGIEPLLSDDFEHVDRRNLRLATAIGKEEYFALLQASTDLVRTWRHRLVMLTAAPTIAVVRTEGEDHDGNEVAWEFASAGSERHGKFTRIESFAFEQFDEAVARARELQEVDIPSFLENACTQFVDLLTSDRWDETHELVAHDVVIDDRRATVGWKGHGRDAWIKYARAAMPGVDARTDVIAIRGDRFALSRVHATARDGFEVTTLAVHELDETGRLKAAVVLDAEELDAAFDELDERYLASDEPSENERLALELIRATNAADRSSIGQLLVDEFEFVDRRSVRIGSGTGAEGFLDLMDTARDLLSVFRCRLLATRNDPLVVIVRSEATDRDGNEITWELVATFAAHEGKVTRIEFFEVENYEEAAARARELQSASE